MAIDIELRDALEFLYADSTVKTPSENNSTVDVARGGIGSVHILLNGLTKGDRICFSVFKDGRAVRNVRWFCLVDVPVEINTGLTGFVEKKEERNPFVARRAPFYVYDAMKPVRNWVTAISPIMALRLHIPMGRQMKPGKYKYLLKIQVGEESRELIFKVNVYQTIIPVSGKNSFPYTNWANYNLMAYRHGLKPWSKAHWRMIKRYAQLMAHARQNVFLIPLSDIFTVKRKVPFLNRSRLRKIVRIFTDAGIYYIEGGHIAKRTGEDWSTTTLEMRLTNQKATSGNGNATLAIIARQLMEEIVQGGWRSRWLQHIADEPTATNASDYRILTGMVRKYMPGIKILDATMDPGLVGSVDIWCPQIQEYQKNRKNFEEQRKSGDKIWFYTCCFPGGPWLNRLLDMELLRPTLIGWGAALYGLDGFLHWGLNNYRIFQDPFKQSVVKHVGDDSLPAGDTHIVYPGSNGPWSSLRLEAQREGMEDYELLRVLFSRDKKLTSEIIGRVIRKFNHYSKKVNNFRLARKTLLDSLDRNRK